MKLDKIETKVSDPVEGLWEVLDILPGDIPAPSNYFFRVVRGLSGFSFINSLTKDEFTQSLRDRFRSPGNSGTAGT